MFNVACPDAEASTETHAFRTKCRIKDDAILNVVASLALPLAGDARIAHGVREQPERSCLQRHRSLPREAHKAAGRRFARLTDCGSDSKTL